MFDSRWSHWRTPDWRERGALLLLAVGAAIVFGPDLVDRLQKAREDVRSSVRDQVPIDVELQRARRLLDDAVPEVRQRREVIVRMELEAEDLQNKIGQSVRELERQRRELLELRQRAGGSAEDFGGSPGSSALVDEIASRFEIYQTENAVLATHRQHLELLQNHLDEMEATQHESVQRIRKLMAEVEHLDARLRLLTAEQTTARPDGDSPDLARCEEQLSYLRRRLTVAERYAADDLLGLKTELRLSRDVQGDAGLLEEIDAFFASASNAAASSEAGDGCE
jgi:chromosome segregation ATPase